MHLRVNFSVPAPKATGGIITGLALPYHVKASPAHPPILPGTRIDYGFEVPLLVGHDITACAGRVVKMWEDEEGLYFLATLNDDLLDSPLPSQLSVGATLLLDDNNQVAAYYIEEISLTDAPAYTATYYRMVAENTQIIENQINMDTNIKDIKARLAAMAAKGMKAQNDSELAALTERLANLETQVSELTTQLADLATIVQGLADASQQAMEASRAATATTGQLNAEVSRAVEEKVTPLRAEMERQIGELRQFADASVEIGKKLSEILKNAKK